MKVALYARYSSDNQRDASIEDQLRVCRARAEREGWTVVDSYSDRAISGASLLRPGVQDLIADGLKRRFDLVLTESLDRLSRDQEDIAGFYKRMRFAGVGIVTLSEGEVTELHIGLKGTMGALYLKDLADKTRRGLRGRVEDGKSGGGLCYGYDVVRQFDSSGEASRGERTINEAEANIVRRIFVDYLAGKSSRTIAMVLNSEGVPGPQGSEWGPSTIHGNPKRGTGILNNELYIGKLIWNRLRYLKNPDTGKRVSRLNPESDWVVQDVPELRVVDQNLWDAVKARQAQLAMEPGTKPGDNLLLNDRRRPKHLFTGLVKCGCCGGGYSMISKEMLGCTNARTKGTCDNRLNIRRDTLEASILNGLDKHLMEPELFEEFSEEFTREVNKARMEARASLDSASTEIKRIDRELDTLLDLILKGGAAERINEKMVGLEKRKKELSLMLETTEAPPPLLHPNLAKYYHEEIAALHDQLGNEETQGRAAQMLRTLVERIELVPNGEELAIVLRGDLAAILKFASGKKDPAFLAEAEVLEGLLRRSADDGVQKRKKPRGGGFCGSQGSLVAGAGFDPADVTNRDIWFLANRRSFTWRLSSNCSEIGRRKRLRFQPPIDRLAADSLTVSLTITPFA
ncbi:recombinase family protein [Sinorhizobium sp. 7-81]|uniref:recombinase family protein n=1 Tax=Sinorhizobium sp. 8-89 TaxID=3049089 RepID=UPI0024C3F0E4|nr:recombinase family protein [Sinorhizobium sp. 8-89]MDK1494400.1 recombinase family protein [Sinorhizobium sp. 8-89]